MDTSTPVGYGWLGAMYSWTALGSGGFGPGLLFAPEAVRTAMGGYAP